MTRRFDFGPMNARMMSPMIKALLITNAAVYVLSMLVGREFVELFGLVPALVIHKRWIWQPLTYLFLHGGAFHLLINLFVLWMFGLVIEAQWGAREFLKFYLLCGVGAGLFNVVLDPGSMTPVVGASGAIYGLLVAFALMYPDAVVYLYFLFPVKAKHMAIFIGVITFLSATGSGGSKTAHLAHLGGMVIGYVYIRWWWIMKIRLKAIFGGGEQRKPRRRSPSRARPRQRARPVRSKASAPAPAGLSPEEEMAEVDRILDKILDKGESSLTDGERDILRRQSRRGREGHA